MTTAVISRGGSASVLFCHSMIHLLRYCRRRRHSAAPCLFPPRYLDMREALSALSSLSRGRGVKGRITRLLQIERVRLSAGCVTSARQALSSHTHLADVTQPVLDRALAICNKRVILRDSHSHVAAHDQARFISRLAQRTIHPFLP